MFGVYCHSRQGYSRIENCKIREMGTFPLFHELLDHYLILMNCATIVCCKAIQYNRSCYSLTLNKYLLVYYCGQVF